MSARQKKWYRRIKLNRIELASLALIIVAILLLLYPIGANYLANLNRGHAVTNYKKAVQKLSKAEQKRELARADLYNKGIWKQQRHIPTKLPDYQSVIPESSGVMGMLTIPAIDMKDMPFFHGTSDATLDKGLGHMQSTSIPIGGLNTRAVLTGHSGVANQKLFSDINKLQKGDIFFIQVLDKHYAYQVHDIKRVKPTQTDAVKIRANKKAATLLTCWPAGINTYRLLVTGYQVPYQTAKNQKVTKRNFWSYEHIVLMLTALAIVILLYAYWRNRKKKGANNGQTS